MFRGTFRTMPRDHFINKIRELGYRHRRDAWRVQIWRHPKTFHELHVRNKDHLEEAWVRGALKQAGCNPDQINSFIACAMN